MFYKTIILVSAFSFLYFASRSILSKKMIDEYHRWGFKDLRITISLLQFLSALGLIFGIFKLELLLLSSFSLTAMMFGAVVVRIKINDSLLDTLPAIFYLLLNVIIFYLAYKSQ
tara:strand:- start:308 stop:649 length:342 start_codon:yes stop_codon:yes gene_type:complete